MKKEIMEITKNYTNEELKALLKNVSAKLIDTKPNTVSNLIKINEN